MNWLKWLFGGHRPKQSDGRSAGSNNAAGTAKYRAAGAAAPGEAHYTSYVDKVKELKREKRHEEAIALLERLVRATEAEAQQEGGDWGVAPWYYEQLAIVYRKERRYADEVAILERYESHLKPGQTSKFAERLDKARAKNDAG